MKPRAVPLCATCKAVATPTTPLSTCARCRIFQYCCRDHQKQHWAEHKYFCNTLKHATTTSTRLEHAFREGHGSLRAVQSLMLAKNSIVHLLAQVPAYDAATERALTEAMDCLRWSRADELDLREAVPSLLLHLGRLQECYDFLKWYATSNANDESDWRDPATPFLSIHNADMTEPIDMFDSMQSEFFWSALAFIKLSLMAKLGTNLQVGIEVANVTEDSSPEDEATSKLLDLHQTMVKVAHDARTAVQRAHACDRDFWATMLATTDVVRREEPRDTFPFGSRADGASWRANHVSLWRSYHSTIDVMLMEHTDISS